MPFTPIDLSITEVLETDFITDFRIITNANFAVLKASFEDLVNTLEISSSGATIGTATPVSSITTDVLVMQSTGFQFKKTGPVATIASLTKNGSNQSVLNVDILTVDLTSTFGALLTADSLAITNASTFSGTTNFNAPAKFNSAFVSSYENVTGNASINGTIGETTITLTSTSRRDIYLTAKLDISLISGTTIAGAWTSPYLDVYIDFDATNPPVQGQEFTFHIVDITNAANTSVLTSLNVANKVLRLVPNVNQNSSNDIYINGGSATNEDKIQTIASELAQYGHCASLIYHIDSSTNDRLIVKSLFALEVA